MKKKWLASQIKDLLTSFPTENSRMKKKCFIALAACALVLLAAGCNNGFNDAALNAMQNNAKQEPVAVESVEIEPKTITLAPGMTRTLTATVLPSNATNKTVTWWSDDEDVATVGDDGTVTAVGNGRASITVTTRDGGFTATCTVTVAEMTVTLNATSLALTPGDTARLEATVRPAGASGREVEWSSDNPNIATVDAGGTVTAGDTLGTAVITATVGSMTATCEVTVKELSALFEMDGTTLTKYTGNAAIVVIPDGVTKIDGAAFYDNKSLEHVTIPGSVESIGNSYDFFYGAFGECTNLKSVTIGEGVKSIGKYAFEECTSLTDVTIPGSVESIGGGAFCGCTSLASVTIPASVTSIGGGAFCGCTSLASVEIPDGVMSIGYDAFEWCTSLASVTIPDGVTSIGNCAFEWCTNLERVTYGGTKDGWGDIQRGYYIFFYTKVTQITDKDGVTFTVDYNGNITE